MRKVHGIPEVPEGRQIFRPMTVFENLELAMKTDKRGEGQRDIPLAFASAHWRPGDYLYADNNGIIVADKQLL